ncbi:hypothetical protein RCL1_003100 [Eukaryota sp. TZLM3-RCL]
MYYKSTTIILNVASESSNMQLVAMLKDVGSCDDVTSSASCLITQRPKQFGLYLSDDEWILEMKMRLNIPCFAATSASKCNCGETATLHHVLNCKKRACRTLIHDSVKHSLRNFVSAHGVPVLLEQTFKQLHPEMSSSDKMDLVTSSLILAAIPLVICLLSHLYLMLSVESIHFLSLWLLC